MTSVRNKILDEAKDIINNDRQNTYGKPEDNFRVIASYWSTWLHSRGKNVFITPYDVAAMMDLMKTARAASSPEHMDNFRDKCGYTGLMAELASQGYYNIIPPRKEETVEDKKAKFPPLTPSESPLVGTMPTMPEDLTARAIRNAEVSPTKQTFEEKGLEYAK